LNSQEPPSESLYLLHRLRDGDASVLAVLLERFEASLLARIRLMMGDRARAVAESNDFLQATFVEVLERIDRVKPPDEKALLRWMTWIARNKIRNQMRTERERRLETLSHALSKHGVVDSSSDCPPALAATGEELTRLAEAIESLPSELQRIVELRELDGLTFAAAGEVLGISEDQGRWLHRKALLRLGLALRSRDPS
jgi:RNA polymerase sigma-70 factor (ECF subfamily)